MRTQTPYHVQYDGGVAGEASDLRQTPGISCLRPDRTNPSGGCRLTLANLVHNEPDVSVRAVTIDRQVGVVVSQKLPAGSIFN